MVGWALLSTRFAFWSFFSFSSFLRPFPTAQPMAGCPGHDRPAQAIGGLGGGQVRGGMTRGTGGLGGRIWSTAVRSDQRGIAPS
jgi:hypothetical protein